MVKFYLKPKPNLFSKIHIRRNNNINDKNIILFRIISFVLVFSIISVIADMKMRPIIKNVGGNALKNTLANVLDGTVNEMVDKLGIKYDEMIDIHRDPDGSINAITIKNNVVNGYKADISDGCSDRLSEFNETIVPIPVGSLLGSAFLNGRGYRIKLRATIYGFAVTDVVSKFESAGINQTRHTIYLNVKASAHAYLGLCHLNESVDETLILIETIIVGKVPETYYVRGKESENEFGK